MINPLKSVGFKLAFFIKYDIYMYIIYSIIYINMEDSHMVPNILV